VADLRRKWSTIPKQQHFTISRHTSPFDGFLFQAALRFFELGRMLVRFNLVSRFIGLHRTVSRSESVLSFVDPLHIR
jgi:hypothetical protein